MIRLRYLLLFIKKNKPDVDRSWFFLNLYQFKVQRMPFYLQIRLKYVTILLGESTQISKFKKKSKISQVCDHKKTWIKLVVASTKSLKLINCFLIRILIPESCYHGGLTYKLKRLKFNNDCGSLGASVCINRLFEEQSQHPTLQLIFTLVYQNWIHFE
jgi:hypothetical protein